QLPMADVVDARAFARAVVGRDPAEAFEFGEEPPRGVAEDHPSERRVLAHDADAGVTRDEHEKACLPLRESARDDGAAGVIEIHRTTSSGSRGSGARPPVRPVLAVKAKPPLPRRLPPPTAPREPTTRMPAALWRLKPEDAFAEACAPR